VLGAVLGAQCGEQAIPAHLKEGLKDAAALKVEIDAFKASIAARGAAL